MSCSVNTFLDGLTSYYQIGLQRPAAHSDHGVRHIPCAHYVPSYVSPFLSSGTSFGRNVTVVAAADAETVHRHERQEREEGRQTTAAVLGGLATVAIAGVSAFFLKGYFTDRQELKKAQEFRRHTLASMNHSEARELLPIVDKHIEILEAKCAKGRNIAFVSGGVLAAAAAAFAGGMFAISWLITAAVVAGVSLAAMGAFAIVWHWSDETSLPPMMQKKVQELQRQRKYAWF